MSRSPRTHVRDESGAVVASYCGIGCCAGCQDCYGMSIGCHQEPCRCDLPCTCRYPDEDTDPKWRDGCERHDETTDTRGTIDDEIDDLAAEHEAMCNDPCPVCGERGPCGYDVEGYPLIHTVAVQETETP